ncbi:MAG: hypothetical protein HKN76_07325 [Saprospiraceae bacterium]|nr:hypothetical protein [Saprospiraceae bacterium]
MANRERIICITQKGINLTPDFALPWHLTNLPADSFSISDRKPFFWKILIESYQAHHALLKIRVIDYHPIDIDVYQQQKVKYKIDHLKFAPLDWTLFEGFLTSFNFKALSPYLENTKEKAEPGSGEEIFQYKIKANLKDARFKLGYISVWTDLPALDHPVELQIKNDHVLPEFEFIKPYFSKVFNRKTFEIDVTLSVEGLQIKNLHCRSKQIDKINDGLIKTLKTSRIQTLRKNPKVILVDKHLFTTDDIFDQIDDGLPGNVFKQDPGDILSTLNELGMVRNSKQLQYLAGRMQDPDQQILITLTPHFGFLFVAKGLRQNHFIWELINSHATYVWSFENDEDVAEQSKKVERLVGLIHEQGREKYKQFYQRDLSQQDYVLRVIVHKHADAGVVDSFPNWRYRLEEMIG